MQETKDLIAYMIAAEKIVGLLSTMEQTIEFMKEYKIEPDEEVKEALEPLFNQYNVWLKS